MLSHRDEIEERVIDIFDRLEVDMPSNLDVIVDYISKDIKPGKDWHDTDVNISFRKWIENKC